MNVTTHPMFNIESISKLELENLFCKRKFANRYQLLLINFIGC